MVGEKLPFEIENELASSLGWDCVPDMRRGAKIDLGILWCKFEREHEMVWSAYPNWMRAEIEHDGTAINHMMYTQLVDALTGMNGVIPAWRRRLDEKTSNNTNN